MTPTHILFEHIIATDARVRSARRGSMRCGRGCSLPRALATLRMPWSAASRTRCFRNN